MCVYENVTKNFVIIYDEDFKADQQKRLAYEMYKQRVKSTLEDMIDKFHEFINKN